MNWRAVRGARRDDDEVNDLLQMKNRKLLECYKDLERYRDKLAAAARTEEQAIARVVAWMREISNLIGVEPHQAAWLRGIANKLMADRGVRGE